MFRELFGELDVELDDEVAALVRACWDALTLERDVVAYARTRGDRDRLHTIECLDCIGRTEECVGELDR